jgi:hypothetical protein
MLILLGGRMTDRAPSVIFENEKSVEDEYRELFHYTSIDALKGILKSNNLWATKATHLNDTSEMQRIWPILEDTLVPLYADAVRDYFKDNKNWQDEAQVRGGIDSIAKTDIANWVKILKDIALGTPGNPGVAEPFIVSFSTHSNSTKQDAYRRKNGRLSQWYGYGDGGGVAIVFDTKKLMALLDIETTSFQYWPSSYTADVVYDDEDDLIRRFPGLFREIPTWMNLLGHQQYDEVHELLNRKLSYEIMTAASRLKHMAFREEDEVRIVAIPLSIDTSKTISKLGHGVDIPVKPINFVSRDRTHMTLNQRNRSDTFQKGQTPFQHSRLDQR